MYLVKEGGGAGDVSLYGSFGCLETSRYCFLVTCLLVTGVSSENLEIVRTRHHETETPGEGLLDQEMKQAAERSRSSGNCTRRPKLRRSWRWSAGPWPSTSKLALAGPWRILQVRILRKMITFQYF